MIDAIKKGEKIVCPNCKTVISVLTENVFPGQSIEYFMFEKEKDSQFPLTCPNLCKKETYEKKDDKYVRFHTGRGWIPKKKRFFFF